MKTIDFSPLYKIILSINVYISHYIFGICIVTTADNNQYATDWHILFSFSLKQFWRKIHDKSTHNIDVQFFKERLKLFNRLRDNHVGNHVRIWIYYPLSLFTVIKSCTLQCKSMSKPKMSIIGPMKFCSTKCFDKIKSQILIHISNITYVSVCMYV